MSLADYAHWNENAEYMWWNEEGKHVEEPEYDPDVYLDDRADAYAEEMAEQAHQDDPSLCLSEGNHDLPHSTMRWECSTCGRDVHDEVRHGDPGA